MLRDALEIRSCRVVAYTRSVEYARTNTRRSRFLRSRPRASRTRMRKRYFLYSAISFYRPRGVTIPPTVVHNLPAVNESRSVSLSDMRCYLISGKKIIIYFDARGRARSTRFYLPLSFKDKYTALCGDRFNCRAGSPLSISLSRLSSTLFARFDVHMRARQRGTRERRCHGMN